MVHVYYHRQNVVERQVYIYGIFLQQSILRNQTIIDKYKIDALSNNFFAYMLMLTFCDVVITYLMLNLAIRRV